MADFVSFVKETADEIFDVVKCYIVTFNGDAFFVWTRESLTLPIAMEMEDVHSFILHQAHLILGSLWGHPVWLDNDRINLDTSCLGTTHKYQTKRSL